jgi:hypothetical protein
MLLCPTTPREARARNDYAAIVGPGGSGGFYTDQNGTRYPEGWFNGAAWSLGILIAVPGNAPDSDDPDAINKPNKRIKIAKVTDGTTKSILLGECAGRDNPKFYTNGQVLPHLFWGNGDHAFAHHGAIVNDTPVDELYSDHVSGLNLGMADGSVRFLSDTTPKRIIDALATRAGEELDHGEK